MLTARICLKTMLKMFSEEVATYAKVILHMQTMRLLGFAAITKTQNMDFERHCLSGRDFLMATESVFWSDWRRHSRCQRLRVSLGAVFAVLS